MAGGMDEVERSLVKLEKEITCDLCQEHYQQPKVLPCLHFYCKDCILKLALRAAIDQPFPCPECHKESFLPDSKVDNLATSVFINRLKDHYTQLEKALSKVMVRSLKHLCQDKIKIFNLPINPFLNTTTSKAVVHKMSEFVLCTATLCDSKPTKPDAEVDCHLSSLYNRFLIKCNVKDIGAGEYHIQYVPTVHGRHELSISMDGQPVAGSPFPVLVCSPPTLLHQPVKVWEGFNLPHGITVNSVGEIIVTEHKGDVVVLGIDGMRLRTIKSSEHQLEHLQGIAVDRDDNIYFIDERTNRVFKSNKSCSKVQVHRVKQVYGPGHIDVAVVGDEVMVTERYNEGVIMVYDRELKYVRQIVGINNDSLFGLSPDSHQNLYICDCEHSSIQVYSKDGEFLHSFGGGESSVKRLEWPWGICVAGQYVYVTDYHIDVNKIVVFTTEGNYVTSFGDYWTYGVCVDQAGFVYVADAVYSKIYVY